MSPKVAVVAEFYPSRRDPVLGVWAHRQALAARDAGAEVRVLVLHRLVPPRASLAGGTGSAARALAARVREPRRQTRDNLEISYVPYLSPRASATTEAGGPGRLRRSRSRCAGSSAPSLSIWSTPTTPCRRATPCAAHWRVPAGAPRRWSSRCTAETCSTPPLAMRRARAPSRAASARRSWCSQTATASPSSPVPTAPARRAWCTSAPSYRRRRARDAGS